MLGDNHKAVLEKVMKIGIENLCIRHAFKPVNAPDPHAT